MAEPARAGVCAVLLPPRRVMRARGRGVRSHALRGCMVRAGVSGGRCLAARLHSWVSRQQRPSVATTTARCWVTWRVTTAPLLWHAQVRGLSSDAPFVTPTAGDDTTNLILIVSLARSSKVIL